MWQKTSKGALLWLVLNKRCFAQFLETCVQACGFNRMLWCVSSLSCVTPTQQHACARKADVSLDLSLDEMYRTFKPTVHKNETLCREMHAECKNQTARSTLWSEMLFMAFIAAVNPHLHSLSPWSPLHCQSWPTTSPPCVPYMFRTTNSKNTVVDLQLIVLDLQLLLSPTAKCKSHVMVRVLQMCNRHRRIQGSKWLRKALVMARSP